jgi:hypothetical protein
MSKMYNDTIEFDRDSLTTTIPTASTLDVVGTLKVGGTAVTSTAAELNILDGVTATNAELNILDGVTSTAAELNKLDGATVTVAEINLLGDTVANITIAYAASGTTDGIEATYTVKDAAGTAIDAIHTLECYISDDANGSGLTATAASGSLTAATGTILTALTAEKHVSANTDANGVLTLLLVDDANTVGERFCVKNPANGKIIVGAATAGTDYEGGS